MFVQSVVRPVSYNSVYRSITNYHAIGSLAGLLRYVDINPAEIPDSGVVWTISEPPDQWLLYPSWKRLGFEFIMQDVPPGRMLMPGHSVFAVTVPYWFLIMFLGAADVILLKEWFKSRVVNSEPEIAEDPSIAVVLDDLPCVHCSYSLKMQPGDSRCPECGAAVMDTLSLNAELARSRPAWLMWLARGNLLLLCVYCALRFTSQSWRAEKHWRQASAEIAV